MRLLLSALVTAGLWAAAPSSAIAQQVPFERSYDVAATAVLDVTTIRGTITVKVGDASHIRVSGAATVRVGFNVPANAPELARRVAANPPVSRVGDTIRLVPPSGENERRAVTVSYDVEVPPAAQVKSRSDSGATRISGVTGVVDVETGSSAIALQDLGGGVTVTTQSGHVRADDVSGTMAVRTGSSAMALSGLGGGLRVRTRSGAVEATFRGRGAVDVQTGSSSVDLSDVDGPLTVVTRSGRVRASGKPSDAWQLSSGSGALEIEFDRDVGFRLDATSRSGDVRLEGLALNGSQAKGQARGTVNGGGPDVKVSSRSGSLSLRAR